MSVAAANAIEYPNYQGGNPVNNTTCAEREPRLRQARRRLVYTFNAIAVYANDNDRLITAFPTTRATC